VHQLIEAAGATEADATVENAARGVDSVTDSLLTAQGLLMYLVGRVDRLRAEQGEEWWQATLEVEFGGIGEAAYRLATLSRRNLTVHAMAVRLARAFVKRRFTEPLLRGHDSLGGLHANTHLPLLVSGARGAQVEAEAQALVAAEGGAADSIGLEAAAQGPLTNPSAPDESLTNPSVRDESLTPPQLLAASVQGFCTLSLGYSYAGALGSSVNEHWPSSAASNGRARRTSFAPAELEDLVSGCVDLAEVGECTRSAAYMLSHCAAACAAEAVANAARAEAAAGADGGEGTSDVESTDSDGFHTQESCTQYNALKLNLELFGRSPSSALADAFERQLLNGVLGIQHPAHPGKMIYMLPLGAGVSKAKANWAGWGGPDDAFWCCYGTGVESFAKLADGAFFEGAPAVAPAAEASEAEVAAAAATAEELDVSKTARSVRPGAVLNGAVLGEAVRAPPALWISQFVPSTLSWRAGGVRLVLERELDPRECASVDVTVTLASGLPSEGPPPVGDGWRRGEHVHAGLPSEGQPPLGQAAKGAESGGCFEARGCTLWLRIPSWAAPLASSVTLVTQAGQTTPLAPPPTPTSEGDTQAAAAPRRPMAVGRFLRVHRRWAEGDRLVAHFGLYAYLEPINDWRPSFESTYALLYGPQMLVGLTTKGEHTLRGAPEEVRRWTRVARCADPHGGKATWAKVRLEAPGADRKPVELMALAAVVDETYTAYFRVV